MSVELTQPGFGVGTGKASKDLAPGNRFWTLSFVQVLSKLLVGVTFFLISLGSLVRNEDAGLACPDWPLCHGHVVPPMDYQVFLEWFHRLVAGFVSIGLLTLSVVVLTNRSLRQLVGKWCIAALIMLAAQVVLGGMTVLGLLHPGWVSSHLAVGLAFFAALVVISIKFSELSGRGRTEPLLAVCFRNRAEESGLSNLAAIALFAIYGQSLMGGGVASNYAGLACPDFPKCLGVWWPPFEGIIRFQMIHRIGAIVVTLVAVTFFVAVWAKKKQLSPSVVGWSVFALVLLGIQIFLGIGNVIWQLPLLMSVAHLSVAALLIGSFVVLFYEIRRTN